MRRASHRASRYRQRITVRYVWRPGLPRQRSPLARLLKRTLAVVRLA
jgi:hypothetical protein